MSDQADAKNAAEDPAAAAHRHAEGHAMTELERIRHSAAHILATAILRIWPDAQFAAGPPVDNGFYYDLDLPNGHRISPEDFERIEAEMKREVKANHVFERVAVGRAEALAMAERGALASLGERPGQPSRFKLDITQNIPARARRSRCFATASSPTCAPARTSRARGMSARSGSRTSPRPTTRATSGTRNSSAFTARRSRTARSWTNTSRGLEEAKRRDHRKLGKELTAIPFRR